MTLFGIPEAIGRMKLIDRQKQLEDFYNSYCKNLLKEISLPNKLWKATSLKYQEVTILDYKPTFWGNDQYGKPTIIWHTFIGQDKPTKASIKELEEKLQTILELTPDYIVIEYQYNWGDDNKYTAKTGVRNTNVNPVVVGSESLWDTEEAAMKVHNNLKELRIAREEFLTKYATLKGKSDSQLTSLGYRSLGWQNGWKSTYYDVNGNVVPYDSKEKSSFGYSKEDHPEYGQCKENSHIKIEWSFNQRGSDNTVCCPVCMLFWKYDCSD